MMLPWMLPHPARPPVPNLGMPGMTQQMLSQVGNASVGAIKGLPNPNQPNPAYRGALLGLGMNMLANRNAPPSGGLSNLPMILQMLQARRGG